MKPQTILLIFIGIAYLLALPLIARAVITTDENPFLLQTEDTRKILLVSSGVPIQAPKLVSKAFVVDKATMERIAKCESTNDPLARNKHSTAKGLYQFLDGSWVYYGKQLWGTIEGHDVFNADDNTELAYYVASKNGYTQDWGSSEYCWGDKILPINK